ncbi:MAG: hypothetical protein AAFY03_05950, partial [Pseudomonadota bacterium]
MRGKIAKQTFAQLQRNGASSAPFVLVDELMNGFDSVVPSFAQGAANQPEEPNLLIQSSRCARTQRTNRCT